MRTEWGRGSGRHLPICEEWTGVYWWASEEGGRNTEEKVTSWESNPCKDREERWQGAGRPVGGMREDSSNRKTYSPRADWKSLWRETIFFGAKCPGALQWASLTFSNNSHPSCSRKGRTISLWLSTTPCPSMENSPRCRISPRTPYGAPQNPQTSHYLLHVWLFLGTVTKGKIIHATKKKKMPSIYKDTQGPLFKIPKNTNKPVERKKKNSGNYRAFEMSKLKLHNIFKKYS